MTNPCPGYSITTPFGKKGSWAAGYHTGDDYAAPGGTKVVATRAGKVVKTGWAGDYGNQVVVETGSIRHSYNHLSRIDVSVGQQVSEGQQVGAVGTTGNSTGNHLHYEERVPPHGYYDHRKPEFNHGSGAGSSGWAFPEGTVIDLKFLRMKGHEQNTDKRSISVGAWQDMLNHHSLVGGTDLPITEQWFDMTGAETRKCQEQHLPPADPDVASTFVGPKQFQHVKEATGAPYVMKDSRPTDPAPQPPASGVPACPPADQFRVGVSNPAFAWMGQRFLVWLAADEIAKEGAAYEPGPRFSSYDEENVRKCQAKMGDTPDPPGSAFFGPKQWTRLAGDPPGGGDVAPPNAAWFVPNSLKALKAEVDARWPDRSTASDGTIGDTAHSTSMSEHNPVGHQHGPEYGTPGAVHAMDLTADGIDVQTLLDATIGDQRVWYVIFDGSIWSKTYDWEQRPYTGSNPHTTHLHVSLRADDQADAVAAETDTSPWIVDLTDPPEPPAPAGDYITRDEYQADLGAIADAIRDAGNP